MSQHVRQLARQQAKDPPGRYSEPAAAAERPKSDAGEWRLTLAPWYSSIQQYDRLLRGDQLGGIAVTIDFDGVPAKTSAKDNLARANRLRALASDITTPSLKGRLLAAAKECEAFAGQKEPEPRVDPMVVKG